MIVRCHRTDTHLPFAPSQAAASWQVPSRLLQEAERVLLAHYPVLKQLKVSPWLKRACWQRAAAVLLVQLLQLTVLQPELRGSTRHLVKGTNSIKGSV